ncbi:hypothetical protein [Arthrobacter alpinus]|uniref:hypothetical protein n=1 Tax=Arthrobacter alpinus TaxID=656366 RepID=UPI0012FEBF4F|nr:hypothetical protein [Arthrobacter alpinus]
MSMILQWTALLVCVACSVWRFPAMIKGRNRGLFWSFVAASMCVALSIPGIYLPVDALLGGNNFANVILRLSLFSVFFLISGKIAAAYNSATAVRLVRGPVGIVVLAICSAGIWITYFLSDLHGSSTGLVGFFDQPSVTYYMRFGFVYMAYVSACLVVPTAKAAMSQRQVLDRVAASLMSLGFLLVCLTIPVQFSPLHGSSLMKIISFSSIICVAAGLAMVWISFMRRPARGHIRT